MAKFNDVDGVQAKNGIRVPSGTNEVSGTAVLVAGTVTVANTRVKATSQIHLTRQVTGGTVGHLTVGTIVAGTSFVINASVGTDTSTVAWLIMEPAA